MRSGVLISVLLHVLLVSGLMLSAPRKLNLPTAPIEVELVRADEIEPPKDEPKPEREKEKEKFWFQMPTDSASTEKNSPALPKVQPPSAQQASSSQPSPQQPQPEPSQPQQQQSSAPSNSQQAALTTPPQSSSSIVQQEQQPQPAPPKPEPSVFDPENAQRLMDLANAPPSGFDSETTAVANISADDRASFKAHVRKCWKLPDGVGLATRVVLRVYLKRDGALVGEPVLIEASASRDGPAVYQAAIKALKSCAPFAFLPAAKYNEWKILDLTVTPRDMAGG